MAQTQSVASPLIRLEQLQKSLPEKVGRCCDISGQAPDLLVALHQRYGCVLDLVPVPETGDLKNMAADGWPRTVAAYLRQQGVPDKDIRIVTAPEDVKPADIVIGLNSFGVNKNIKPLARALNVFLQEGTLILADIRHGSGGFAFFRQYGSSQVLETWEHNGKPVKRAVVVTAPPSTEGGSEDKPWSEVAAGLIGPNGFYRENDTHSFTFVQRSDVLCVTFDNLDIAMNNRRDRRPWGYSFIEKQNWSMLGAMANGWTWYRDPWVYEQFDELRDSGFFRQFRRVIFYGASMGGYAALVFSSACPGAEVVVFSPQSTLDKKLVPWESRYKAAWGYDYSGPYGDAATTTGAAHRVSLFYDPYMPLDKGHIDRLSGSNLVHLRCPFFGHRLGSMLQQLGILQPLVLSTMAGDMTHLDFVRQLRARRTFRRYRMEMVQRLLERGHNKLAAQLCRYALREDNNRFFHKTLKDLGES